MTPEEFNALRDEINKKMQGQSDRMGPPAPNEGRTGDFLRPAFGGHNPVSEVVDNPGQALLGFLEFLGAGGPSVAATAVGKAVQKGLVNELQEATDDDLARWLGGLLKEGRERAKPDAIGAPRGLMDDVAVTSKGPVKLHALADELSALPPDQWRARVRQLVTDLEAEFPGGVKYEHGVTHEIPFRSQTGPVHMKPQGADWAPRFSYEPARSANGQPMMKEGYFFDGYAPPLAQDAQMANKVKALLTALAKRSKANGAPTSSVPSLSKAQQLEREELAATVAETLTKLNPAIPVPGRQGAATADEAVRAVEEWGSSAQQLPGSLAGPWGVNQNPVDVARALLMERVKPR